jgi:putative transposase
MAEPSAQPDRKRPSHFPTRESFNRSTLVLVTVCTDRRRPLLARAEAVALLTDVWQSSATWRVGCFVVLPDHVHLFCAPGSADALSVAAWVRFWKSAVARRWPWPKESPVWQKNFWDRQLRSGEHYEERWRYVRENSVRHGLVERAEDWPWQGEITRFEFHDPA